jgi:hypothetical protein
VTNLNVVIDLCVVTNTSNADSCTVDCAAHSYLNVVTYDCNTNLRNLCNSFGWISQISEAISPDNCVVMNDAIRPDATSFAHNNSTMKLRALSDVCISVERYMLV